MLVRYIRDNKGRKIGCLVAEAIGEDVYFGWSKQNKKDRFSKKVARDIALDRAFVQAEGRVLNLGKIPSCVMKWLPSFEDRAVSYYKDKDTFHCLSFEDNTAEW